MPPLVAPPDDLLLPLVAAEARDAGVEANAAVGSAGADYWSGRAERRTRTLRALSCALRALLLSAGLCAAAYALMRGLRSPSRSPPARQIRGAEAADRQGATFEGHLATVSRRWACPACGASRARKYQYASRRLVSHLGRLVFVQCLLARPAVCRGGMAPNPKSFLRAVQLQRVFSEGAWRSLSAARRTSTRHMYIYILSDSACVVSFGGSKKWRWLRRRRSGRRPRCLLHARPPRARPL